MYSIFSNTLLAMVISTSSFSYASLSDAVTTNNKLQNEMGDKSPEFTTVIITTEDNTPVCTADLRKDPTLAPAFVNVAPSDVSSPFNINDNLKPCGDTQLSQLKEATKNAYLDNVKVANLLIPAIAGTICVASAYAAYKLTKDSLAYLANEANLKSSGARAAITTAAGTIGTGAGALSILYGLASEMSTVPVLSGELYVGFMGVGVGLVCGGISAVGTSGYNYFFL